MINPVGGTARERLGKVIAFHIEQRKWNTRRVADTTSAPMQVVEAWKAGKLAPTGGHWGKLRNMVHRDLFNWTQLWQEACREQEHEDQTAREAKKYEAERRRTEAERRRTEAERRRTEAAEAEQRRKKGLTTTMADKLQAALQTVPTAIAEADEPLFPDLSEPVRVAAEPEPEPESAPAEAPEASDSKPEDTPINGTQKRQNWMRSYFRQYHGATIDAALSACKATFGVGVNLDIIRRIRREVLSELQTPETVELEPKIEEAEIVQLAPVKTVEEPVDTVDTVDENVNTAIQLLLDAIPNLRTFTLMIADDGTPSVDFTERVVQIVEKRKSFQVKR